MSSARQKEVHASLLYEYQDAFFLPYFKEIALLPLSKTNVTSVQQNHGVTQAGRDLGRPQSSLLLKDGTPLNSAQATQGLSLLRSWKPPRMELYKLSRRPPPPPH